MPPETSNTRAEEGSKSNPIHILQLDDSDKRESRI